MIRRVVPLLVWLATLTVSVGALHRLGADPKWSPPPMSGVVEWVEARGPAVALFALLRLAALGVGWYLLATTSAALVLRLVRADAAAASVERCAPPAVGRIVRAALGVSLAVSALTVAPAGASDAPPPTMRRLPNDSTTTTTAAPPTMPPPTTHRLPNEWTTTTFEQPVTGRVPGVPATSSSTPTMRRLPDESATEATTPTVRSVPSVSTPSSAPTPTTRSEPPETTSTVRPPTMSRLPEGSPSAASASSTPGGTEGSGRAVPASEPSALRAPRAASGVEIGEPEPTAGAAALEASPRPPAATATRSSPASASGVATSGASGPGASDAPAVTMRRLGDEPAPDSPTTDNTWVVRPGDHLWAIAEQTLAEAWQRTPTDREIDPFWRSIVERNRPALRDPRNPDLLVPGDRIEVPAAPQR